MILKALELQGFKSFPDKTVFHFGKGITAVVGPNGSGKSNIADAVRWVLGEQSTRNLRGAKMQDVIFGGTSIRKALGFAEVTLDLDNSALLLANCDKKQVRVTRRYYRSGESEYLLNGEVVRLRDIHELFMNTGLGRDGYSLVSQGRVADLISSKSNQRREMLEEAAGISHYRYRRGDANKRLEQAQENMIRLRDILGELEGRVGPLKTQSEKAEKFLVLAKEKKELEIGLWLHTIDSSKEKLREQQNKISIAGAQYSDAENRLSNTQQQMEDTIAQGQDITAKIESIRQNASVFEEQAAHFDAQAAVEKNTILHNEQTIERLKNDIEHAHTTEQSLERQISDTLAEIDELNALITAKRLQLHESAQAMGGVRQEDTVYADKIAQLSKRIAVLTAEIADKRIDFKASSSSIEEIESRTSAVTQALAENRVQHSELESQGNEINKALEDIKEEISGLSNALSGYEMRVDSRAKKEQQMKKELDEMSVSIHKNNSKMKMLDELEKNMEGYSGSVKAIIKHAGRGMLAGIHGPVSQLIKTPAKYTAAIETTLGAAIQNIVTDDEQAAKRAIFYLRDNRLGRATFLPLTSIKARPFTEKGLENCDGYVAMAHEIVSYEEKYGEIIKSLLARTVVAEDLDSAVVIAKKYSYRFKIVTLDGQVLNAGGSMTGGSKTHQAGILSRANEIERLSNEIAQLNKKYSESQSSHKQLVEELSLARAEFDSSQAEMLKLQEALIRKESEAQLNRSRFEGVTGAIAELEREMETSEVRVNEFAQVRSRAEGEIKSLTNKMEIIEEELSSITASRENLDQKRAELSELEASINIEILSAGKDIEAKNESINTLKARMASHGDRLGTLNEEISEIGRQNTEIAKKIEDLTSHALGYRAKAQETETQIENLAQERIQAQTLSTKLRSTEREINNEREKLSGELARLEERKSTIERHLDEAISKLFDEYQLTKTQAQELEIVIGDYPKAQRTLQEIKSKIRALGSVNVGAVEEYREVLERYTFMKEQLDDIDKTCEELAKLINELTQKMSEQFKEQFVKINEFFSQTFVELFGGGRAQLILTDENDVLECHIDIKVQPPGKNVQNIDLLSGGEKGLAAIALLFAILKVSPSPFCIFDEVEAALDDLNVTRYAKYVRRMTHNTQFILITHRRGTMEEADVLYGITMQEKGVSKMLELKTAEMAKKLGLSS